MMPLRDVLLALCAKWISEGEYWRGDPIDAARLDCADDLLTALGEDLQTFSMAMPHAQALLEPLKLKSHPSAADQAYQREREARCKNNKPSEP